MKHVKIVAFDLPDAWYQVLKRIWSEGEDFCVKYGSELTDTKKLDVTLEVQHPENKPTLHEKAPCDMRYVMNYFMEYLWFGEKKPDETYTYSSRLRSPVDQVEAAIHRYTEELFDRQVTMVVRIPEDIQKQVRGKRHEPPCLTVLDTEICRDEHDGKLKLTLTGYWRSWDAYAALPANLAGLQLFSETFAEEINAKGVEKHGRKWEEILSGKMIMHSKNCHIYKRQLPLVDELVQAKKPTFAERVQISRKPGN